jgi:hypothetical protein
MSRCSLHRRRVRREVADIEHCPWRASAAGRFLVSFAMDDHHILILSIVLGMAAAGIVFGTFLVHAHG